MRQFSVFSYSFSSKKRALPCADGYFVKHTRWQARAPAGNCDLVATHSLALLTASGVFALRSRRLAVIALPVPAEN